MHRRNKILVLSTVTFQDFGNCVVDINLVEIKLNQACISDFRNLSYRRLAVPRIHRVQV